MENNRRYRLLAVLFACWLHGCGVRPSVTESQLIGNWQCAAVVNGTLSELIYTLQEDHSFKVALVERKNDKIYAGTEVKGRWALHGRTLELTFDGVKNETEQTSSLEIDKVTVAEWTAVEEGQTVVMRRASEPARRSGSVAAAEPTDTIQTPAPAEAEPEISTLTVLSSQFVADHETYSLYYTLQTPMNVKVVAGIDGGPVTLIARKGHFSEASYASMLTDLVPSMVIAAVGGEDGTAAKKDFYDRLNELTSSPLSKINAIGRYESEWVKLPAGEHTVLIDNSGEIGVRRGDVVVNLTVYGTK